MPVTIDQNNHGSWFFKSSTSSIVLSSVAIVLRFWSRAVGQPKNKLWWDDWTALFAWIHALASSITIIVWKCHGLGKHVQDIPITDVVFGAKLLLVIEFLVFTSVSLVKVSALLFYTRVFSNEDWRFNMALRAGYIATTASVLAFLPTIVFNCTPVSKFWERNQPGTCINLYAWYVASGVADVVIDVMVLLLPIPKVWSLRCGAARKAMVFFACICGCLAVVPSVGRLAMSLNLTSAFISDITWGLDADMIWAVIEPSIGVISICVPSWFHLFKRAKEHGFISLFTSRNLRKKGVIQDKVSEIYGAGSDKSTQDDNDCTIEGDVVSNEDKKYLSGPLAAELAEQGALCLREA